MFQYDVLKDRCLRCLISYERNQLILLRFFQRWKLILWFW